MLLYIGVDTSIGQFIYVSGDNTVATVNSRLTRCAFIENLAADDDGLSLGALGAPATIESVGCSYKGTGTLVATIALEDGGGNAMTHATPTCKADGTDFTFTTVTAANTLNTGELLRFNTTNAVDPETDEYTICVEYIWTRQ